MRGSRVRLGVVIALLLLATGLVVGVHAYIARRLVLDPQLVEPFRSLALATLALLGSSLFLYPVAERRLRPPLLHLVVFPPLLWMGVLFMLLNLLALSDALFWLLGAAAPEPGQAVVAQRARALAVVGLAGVATAAGLRSALRPPPLRRVGVALERWPRALDGFRIVQVSDVHLGPLLGRRFARDLAARVNALRPDLIALTGDLVDGSARRLAEEVAPLAALAAPHGVYFVTGNHDHYSGADRWAEQLTSLGIRPLRNERVAIGAGQAGFDLAGVDDHRGDFVGGSPEDLERALTGRDAERAVVLLAHDPSTFKRAAPRGVDLQLSGHTHGGQIWPFGYLVRLVVPYLAGLYRVGGSQLYVSRGTGFWGPPLRLFAPAELTELTLRRANA